MNSTDPQPRDLDPRRDPAPSGRRGRRARRVFFWSHLVCGLVVGLYLLAISLSGGVLVYRNELRAAFQPQPRVVEVGAQRMTEEQLAQGLQPRYPGVEIFLYDDPEDPSHAVTMMVNEGTNKPRWLVDPYTGEVLGKALPFGWRATSWLLDLHDNLLAGDVGRRVNGVGAIALSWLCLSGAVIWWPGRRRLRRSLGLDWRGGASLKLWTLHSAAGFWAFALIALWGVTGIYLCFPEPFQAAVDWIEPVDPTSFEPRTGDNVLYWLAYLHFGRFGGEPTKLLWAVVALAPPVLFGTGAVLSWGRYRRRLRKIL